MAKDFAKRFYKSTAWEQCREAFIHTRIQADGGLCERCHAEPGFIVHHKVWLNRSNIEIPEVSLNMDHLEYLCHKCHDDEHVHHSKPLLCFFDENGRPVNVTSAERNEDKNEER